MPIFMEAYLGSKSIKAYQRTKVQNSGLLTKKKEKMIDGWGCTVTAFHLRARETDQKRTW